jgi:hypothetical protein
MGLDFRKRSGRIANGSLLIVPGQTINGVKVYQTTFSQKDTSYDYAIPTNTPSYLFAQQVLSNNSKVKIDYKIKNFVWKWDYSSRIIIDNIELVE